MGNSNNHYISDEQYLDNLNRILNLVYNNCKSSILLMKDRSNLPIKKNHYMNPNLYDDKASQQLLELLISKKYRSSKRNSNFTRKKG